MANECNSFIYNKYKNPLRNEFISLGKTFTFSSHTLSLSILLSLFVISFVFCSVLMVHFVNATSIEGAIKDPGPILKDFHLKVDVVYNGLKFPSSMAFLGPNDILVLEKNEGLVQRIVNGTLLPQPLLNVPVANLGERGLLGIAIAKNQNGHTYVFLYYTKSGGGITGDDSAGIPPLCNCLYRYDFIDNKLVNPKLLLSLPAPVGGVLHNGGKLLIGPDQNLYLGVGDIGYRTLTQNFRNSTQAIGSVIYRMSQDGKPVGNILGKTDPINKFYAYGIRNTFGMDFDPVTKKLWDTENGPSFGDEINLVEPGFNSGWAQIAGLWKPEPGPPDNEVKGPLVLNPNSTLVDFGGNGKYRSPEFVWNYTVGPTALKFFNSSKLGKEYENDMFVGDINYGNLYHFKLNGNRTGLVLEGLRNKTLEKPGENYNFLFGINFGRGITDLQVGPDGYLYVLSIPDWVKQEAKETVGGQLYRIRTLNTLN
jgi:glucose/arabinose dehydrogenase